MKKLICFSTLAVAASLTAASLLGLSPNKELSAGAGSPTITPSSSGLFVPQPDEHPVSSFADGDLSSYTWFHTPTEGSYIQIAFEDVYQLTSISVYTGYGVDFGDTFNANVKISTDGSTFYNVGSFVSSSHEASIALTANAYYAQYVRLTNLSASGWLALREITAETNGKAPSNPVVTTNGFNLYGDEYGLGALTSTLAIIDGNVDTYAWYQRVTVAGAYIQLDLGSVTAVRNLEFLQSKQNSIDDFCQTPLTFAYSEDGVSFTTLAVTTGSERQVFLNFEAVSARYIRASLNQAKSSDGNDFIIREFAVNVAYPVTYSSDLKVYDAYRSGYNLSHVNYAVDGNANTFLDFDGSSRGDSSWFMLDLKNLKKFDEIDMTSGALTGDKITACSVSYSTDGSSFTTIGSYAQEDGVYTISVGAPVTARYVRFSSLSGGWMTVNEIAVKADYVDAFVNYVTGLTCADVTSYFTAMTTKSDMEAAYATLTAEDIASLDSGIKGKYDYFHSYCEYTIANHTDKGILDKAMGENEDSVVASAVVGTILLLCGVLFASLTLKKKSLH